MGFGDTVKDIGKKVSKNFGSQGALKFFKKGDPTTVTQGPLETPERRQARQNLLGFAETGQFGGFEVGAPLQGFTPGSELEGFTPGEALPGFEAGEQFGGPLGSFDPTSQESAGLENLQTLLASGRPELLGIASGTLSDLLSGDRFDPTAPGGEFQGFKEGVTRETQEAVDRAKREAAFSKNLFSKSTIEGIGDIQAKSSEALTRELGRLSSEFTGRKLSAVPLALQAARAEEDINLGRIGASQEFGGLERILGDVEARRELEEFQRTRGEKQADLLRRRGETAVDATRRRGEKKEEALRIRAEEKTPLEVLSTILGTPTQFGVESLTLPGGKSTAEELLLALAPGFGAAAGQSFFSSAPKTKALA